jgi:hypothetical protein
MLIHAGYMPRLSTTDFGRLQRARTHARTHAGRQASTRLDLRDLRDQVLRAHGAHGGALKRRRLPQVRSDDAHVEAVHILRVRQRGVDQAPMQA